jgi:hypothetical protein
MSSKPEMLLYNFPRYDNLYKPEQHVQAEAGKHYDRKSQVSSRQPEYDNPGMFEKTAIEYDRDF